MESAGAVNSKYYKGKGESDLTLQLPFPDCHTGQAVHREEAIDKFEG
jgi:hypothetical protein